MIGHLRGRALRVSPDRVLLDVAGVGYEIQVPLTTLSLVEQHPPDEDVALWIHTHVREDQLQLYGFSREREREVFLRLIAVSGIGPRLALTVLSGLSPAELARAVAQGDVARLQGIPGIGRKTAERLIVELRDRLEASGADLADEDDAPRRTTDDELVAALVGLGYRAAAAEKALGKIRRDEPDLPVAEQLRASLRVLSRL